MKTELTNEQKRVLIAETCGWKAKHYLPTGDTESLTKLLDPDGEMAGSPRWGEWDLQDFWNHLPDYFGSLDAMHEAEKALRLRDRADYWTYGKRLDGIVARYNSDNDRKQEECIAIFEATAAQRAEAFGLTLNLWK